MKTILNGVVLALAIALPAMAANPASANENTGVPANKACATDNQQACFKIIKIIKNGGYKCYRVDDVLQVSEVGMIAKCRDGRNKTTHTYFDIVFVDEYAKTIQVKHTNLDIVKLHDACPLAKQALCILIAEQIVSQGNDCRQVTHVNMIHDGILTLECQVNKKPADRISFLQLLAATNGIRETGD